MFDNEEDQEAKKNQDNLYKIIEKKLYGTVNINLIKVLYSHYPNERENITYAVNEENIKYAVNEENITYAVNEFQKLK